MNLQIIKRNGRKVPYESSKIRNAIAKAAKETGEMTEEDINNVAHFVEESIVTRRDIDVETIQNLVEEELMMAKFPKTAKAYILYRDKQNQNRKRDIFKMRKNLKPYEYPELESFKEAIQHSYWLFSEFSYTSDVQDYKVNVNNAEREAIKRAMLAIAQVEVDVKEFWGNLYKRLPKPELANVGATFAESEVRHADAYANLLELLGLNGEFEKIDEIPALNERIAYLKKHNQYALTGRDRDYITAVLLFSSAIEHISLFSQFLIIMSFNKYKNLFSGVSNAIEATSKEEQLHGEFGVALVNVVREEKPDWFNKELAEEVYDVFRLAYESENRLLDWIFECGELDFLPKATIQEFLKNRLNNSLASVGLERIFEVDIAEVSKTDWFDDEVVASSHKDFFYKRSTNYTKRSQSITANDLF